jgi:hypothetical protein
MDNLCLPCSIITYSVRNDDKNQMSTDHHATGEIESSVYNVLRILQKNGDGRWKVHPAI